MTTPEPSPLVPTREEDLEQLDPADFRTYCDEDAEHAAPWVARLMREIAFRKETS